MLAFVTLKSCTRDEDSGVVLDNVPTAPAPDADTPADTIKTLTANVAAMTAEVEALPLVAWRAGDLYVTAAKLTNKTDRPQTLDPRTLRGRWLTAAFQHNRLHDAGSEADRTVVYLISDRPFAASLR